MSDLTKRVPVILDTDIGGDIDDTWALAMLLGLPDKVDLRLVTTAIDNTPEKTRLVAKILTVAGRTDIPIGTGIKTSDNRVTHDQWMEGFDMVDYAGTVHEDGVQALIDAIHAAPDGVVLMAIGPMTNLAAALDRDPSIANKARVVAMAGSVFKGYNDSPTPEPECNVVSDIPAFRKLLAAPWDVTITPTDGCGTLRLVGDRYARVRDSQATLAKLIVENYMVWVGLEWQPDHGKTTSSILFDTAASYLTFDESWCVMQDVKISVDDKGLTYPDDAGKLVHCHVGWTDLDAFEELLIASITDGR